MVIKNCNYLIASQVEAAVKVVSANSKADSKTIELLWKELNNLDKEVISVELDFLNNTIHNQREKILELQEKNEDLKYFLGEKEKEIEWYKEITQAIVRKCNKA